MTTNPQKYRPCVVGWVFALFAFAVTPSAMVSAAPPGAVDFNFDIKPILSDRCYACHGPDAEKREGELRLDTKAGAYGESQTGDVSHVVKPHDLSQSELYRRIVSNDADLRMPPTDSKLSLTADEVDLLRRWIEQGAEWKDHWSLLPPVKRSPPVVPATDRPINDIDRFILASLEHEQLQPAAMATREQLIRRLSFDLTGLPPTLEEVDAFVADTSADAYERLVDRLLASKRFGERMAVDWLDVARYADTYGYQSDVYRDVWPWRDWVVRSFNENLPYDDFITWQLAGDLLPNATRDQILATAFNRMHRQTNEGGSIEEEFRVEYVADRVNTFGAAFLGLTLECARCHDHKYDPILQRDYYSLFAFFDNIDESGLYSHFTNAVPTPTLMLTPPNVEQQIHTLEQKIIATAARLEKTQTERRQEFNNWLAQRTTAATQPKTAEPPQPAAPQPKTQESTPAQATPSPLAPPTTGLLAHYTFDDIQGAEVANAVAGQPAGKLVEAPQVKPSHMGTGLQLSGENSFTTPVGGKFTRDDAFSIALWLNNPVRSDRVVVFHRSRAWTDAGSRGYQLLIEDGRLSASLIHFWPGNALRIRTRAELPVGKWTHVAVTYDGSSQAAGLSIFVNGEKADCEVVRDKLKRAITGGGATEFTIGERFRDRGFKNGSVDELLIYERELAPLEVRQIHDGGTLAELLAIPTDELTAQQQSQLEAYYFLAVDQELTGQRAELKTLRTECSKLVEAVPEIMVMREMETQRPTYLLNRGAYDARGVQVSRATPAALPDIPAEAPKNRLGLARWLTSPTHPLTSRVAVNRLWQMMFGRGLVMTPEDFGSQGQLPTHPELLDWLALRFIDSGWNTKALLKTIAMSATYRQSSACSPELYERDPENRWLARGPRFRLPAEMIRDNALLAGGLLVETFGGPPVKPYQPDGLWREKSSATYKRDEGPGSHRRSLYTYWKRTSPPPAMMTLDAAKRDVCVVQRQTTATPLQSLLLLNDPQYVEAARALAQRALKLDGANLQERVEFVFRTLTSRRPTAREADVLATLYQEQLDEFQAQPENAAALLKVGDHPLEAGIDNVAAAAMTVLAEAVMNFEEAVTKR